MDRNDALISELRARVHRASFFPKLTSADSRLDVTGATVEARALLIAALQDRDRRPIAVITAGDAAVADFDTALRLFHREPDRVSVYPAPSLSPYQDVAPSLGVVRDEIHALGMLIDGAVDVLVVPSRALFQRLPRAEDFRERILRMADGDDLDMHSLLQQLVENGFVRTDLVGEAGEFAFRGGILDVFPPNLAQPMRVELFGDTIDSLRWFDVETQRSEEPSGAITIYPITQFPVTKETRQKLAKRISLDFMDPHFKRDVADKIEKLQENGTFPGIEHYVPVAMESATFADYIRDWDLILIEPDQITTTIARYESLLRNEYEIAAEKGRAVYAPERLGLSGTEILPFIGKARLGFSEVHIRSSSSLVELHVGTHPTDRYANRLSEFPADVLRNELQQIFFTATKGGREKIERLLKEFSVPFSEDRIGADLTITPGNIARGFTFDELGVVAYSEWDLFEPPTSTRIGSRRKKSDAFVSDLRDLKTGDYIVHVDHGVGRFLGLQRIPFGDTEREVMQIEYGGGGKLLMPMENLNLIQRFTAGEEAQPQLDKLGGTSWGRKKASVKKAMRDMADELLKLYATRRMVHGHAFAKDSPWQFDFEDAFEFDETDDQMTAIEDVKSDMESRKPMDRLLCGDVGYGKTEVAMRAAFKSVMDGKQVAVLAPTTVLTFQHYRTFLRRFASFPVTIELLTRYYSAKELKEILKKVETGEIDVIVGTHRLLSKDVAWKDLGLVVIDEEQRFGVAQKERLKAIKKSVDVLAMSATPIPRTLHMSLVGIRDISVIETPPKDRLAIQTAVVPFDDEFIREAIEFEVGRGGQVFFVHNRVESIYAMKEMLERIVPGLRVIVGHGQMDERELERAMLAFINREYDLLLATTIIENGIDIPACNTILINHAERFGLSQLYQLRGRVGRSDRLAFCYLLVPSDRVLSADARKRLAAIQEFSDLGAGFRIAARDLEIRGAGNILGGEQSGQIAAVGFEMYTKLLEETVREMKGEKIEEEVETSMNLGVDIYIPREYIGDENLRMTFYKKIASASTEERLTDIRNEMRDRFGALPQNVDALLHFVKVKWRAKQLGVLSVVREGARAVMKLTPHAKVDPNKLLVFLSENPQAKFSPNGVLSFPLREHGMEVIDAVEQVLHAIAA
ncbi:MAG TPA: transcription-repair coupling factor [Thermoanaerobaculia bacterium]|jgi:transcription-repair coupling factor (superfamily II helicase)|nr:transcription-repair coupling factor [Thermoanaerobaculia bacterium]